MSAINAMELPNACGSVNAVTPKDAVVMITWLLLNLCEFLLSLH